MDRLLAWGESFVSFDRLLCALEAGEVSPDVASGIELGALLYLPPFLEESTERRIRELADGPRRVPSAPLERLRTAAAANPYRSLARQLLEILLDEGLEELLIYAAQEPLRARPPRIVINKDEAKAFVRRFLDEAESPLSLKLDLDLHRIDVEFTDTQSGYAEFWPREMLPEGQPDRLIVHLNTGTLEYGDLEATLSHEIHGHAVFYALQRAGAATFIDHGAMFLVEGWATVSPMNSPCSPRVGVTRSLVVVV